MQQLWKALNLPEEESEFIINIAIKFKFLIGFFFLPSALLINTSDRVIRVYDSKQIIEMGKDGEPEPIQKLQDLVNK